MSIIASKDSISLRSELAELRAEINALKASRLHLFWFAGDGTETDFALTKGWKPLTVFDGGSLQKTGSADEYEVSFDGFAYTVSFAVAPTNGNDICIIGEHT